MITFLKTSHIKKCTHTHCKQNDCTPPPMPHQVEKYEEDEGKKGGGTTHYSFPPIKRKRDCHGWQYIPCALVFMSLVFRHFKTWKGLMATLLGSSLIIKVICMIKTNVFVINFEIHICWFCGLSNKMHWLLVYLFYFKKYC